MLELNTAGLTKEEKLAFVAEADKSILHWAKAFAPKAFHNEFSPEIHGRMALHLDRPLDPEATVLGRCSYYLSARDVGKSALLDTMDFVREACMQRMNYGILASHVDDQASEHLATVKWQFENNQRIHDIFGDIRGKTWNEGEIHFKHGAKIKATGFRGKSRGARNVDMSRPDKVVGDDMETKESVQSEAMTSQLIKWWFADIAGSLDTRRGRGHWIGTWMSDTCALVQLADLYPEQSLIMPLFDSEMRSYFPQQYSDAQIQELYKKYKLAGEEATFWAEYGCKSLGAQTKMFKPEQMGAWVPGPDGRPLGELAATAIIVDPANTDKSTSDYSPVMVCGLFMDGKLGCLDYTHKQIVTDEMYEDVAQMVVKWNVYHVYVETYGLGEYVLRPLRDYLRNAGLYCEVSATPRKKSSKLEHIRGLVPYAIRGALLLPPGTGGPIARELCGISTKELRVKNDDLADVLAYAPVVFESMGFKLAPTESFAAQEARRMSKVLKRRVV
jgi:hypothetical protein